MKGTRVMLVKVREGLERRARERYEQARAKWEGTPFLYSERIRIRRHRNCEQAQSEYMSANRALKATRQHFKRGQ
jgi:hypothetical protein